MLQRRLAAILLACAAWSPALAARPSVVFILLDTTRADRLGAWGNPRPTSPTLDRLAGDGALFARHFANSHATRPSMPQLMSGRYYHANILGSFQTDAHPREMSFARPDPTATLLPAALRSAGYVTEAVSAHTWVDADSAFGRTFDHFELLPFTAEQGHGDAKPLVDRAVALWRERERSRPLFLYLHFMDMHIPRTLPEGGLRFPVPDVEARRFRPNGEPAFGRDRRRWNRNDARDFTALDRVYYTAVYDTRIQYADEQIARLVAAIRADDPELRDTIIVVTADHGEELGEDGYIEHSDTLADGVQHVPWIIAGGPVVRGQRCDAMSEHVDVVPSLLRLLDVPLPAGVVVDGQVRLDASGRFARPCGEVAAYYAWEEYQAVRTHHFLLEERTPDTFGARCQGAERLYHMDGLRRRPVDGPHRDRRLARLRVEIEARLAARDRAYRTSRYDVPIRPFLLRTDFWQLRSSPIPRCVRVDEDTPAAAFDSAGWLWTGRGVTIFEGVSTSPLRVWLGVPAGVYRVEAASTPIGRRPWLWGYARWRRKSFLSEEPSEFLPVGTVDASAGVAEVTLGPEMATGHHVLGLRLSPPGTTAAPSAIDQGQRERLKALGYVQ